MTWNINNYKKKVYNRNPLENVVFQLRFHPILKIEDKIPDFQECIRDEYPIYQIKKQKTLMFDPVGNIEGERQENRFQFLKEDKNSLITIGTVSLSIDELNHKSSKDLLKNAELALNSLVKVYSPIKTVRLGLRYINSIDKDVISKDINKALDWDDLISEPFINIPKKIVDLTNTRFYNEITSDLKKGSLTLRNGLLLDPNSKKLMFKIDIDRYFEYSYPIEETIKLLKTFSDDIYDLFSNSIKNSMEDWMSLQQTT